MLASQQACHKAVASSASVGYDRQQLCDKLVDKIKFSQKQKPIGLCQNTVLADLRRHI